MRSPVECGDLEKKKMSERRKARGRRKRRRDRQEKEGENTRKKKRWPQADIVTTSLQLLTWLPEFRR